MAPDRKGPAGGDLLLRTLRFGRSEDPVELREAWGRASLDRLPALVLLERCATWLLRRLAELGVEGAIVGKAIYTGDVKLGEAIKAIRELQSKRKGIW